MRELPRPGEFYYHFKDKLYQIVAVASHSETREQMVVYQALYGDYGIYVRPLDMFMSEVDHVKYPEVTQRYRFEHVIPKAAKKEVHQEVSIKEQQIEEETKEAIAEQTNQESGQIDPNLLAFLDADSYSEKIEVLQRIRKTLTEQVLQTIAISLDYTLGDGDFNDQYESVMFYLETHARYEGNRLR
ncbi:MAG: DUF1653 domain-containing protein [bacterium]|nr:DUF1653 domain-containing protein [bacterium]